MLGGDIDMPARAIQRVTTRATLELILCIFSELAKLTNGDWLRAYVLLSIEAANWEHIVRRRGRPCFDEAGALGRPVSRLALSESLKLPRETVRRIVAELVDLGLCRLAQGGVLVEDSDNADRRLSYPRAAIHRSVLKLIRGLETLGIVGRQDRPVRAGRLADRVESQDPRIVYYSALYYASLICAHEKENYPSFQCAILFNAITVLNVRHLVFDASKSLQFSGADTPPPDSERVPVKIVDIAALVGVSAESCRRHLVVLEQAGLCVRSEARVVVPAAALQRPELVESGRRVHHWTMQMLADLSGEQVAMQHPRRVLEAASSN
jgi:hypothetical protein